MLVLGHECSALRNRLRDEKMIEWIAMMQGQFSQFLEMRRLNCQKIEGFHLKGADHLGNVGPQFSDSDLDRDFP